MFVRVCEMLHALVVFVYTLRGRLCDLWEDRRSHLTRLRAQPIIIITNEKPGQGYVTGRVRGTLTPGGIKNE
ncbi:uncharacterized protein LY79DRAFT_11758 [Colletotrichum navitas]|uniref:Uncharacterized protein n=1 Tax=Colletotrichum navitas TaxID=681940 RepID=A0AAD8QCT3_9PEZI|nr:uncharacterized protein LY79DRAFT_11758 [Colletotrichum navitas]KAK1600233.1 hypothetical protein LY79DRAFT_11758 [Colletotrichum navitas]